MPCKILFKCTQLNSSVNSLAVEGIISCHSQFMHVAMPVMNFRSATKKKKTSTSVAQRHISVKFSSKNSLLYQLLL